MTVPPTPISRAVVLSYASQDTEAARRICEALRSAGVEVWFDVDGGLEHGDEWDAKIRRQIKECVLFIPLISANTQARHEGYFRVEWDLASERAQAIASGVAFILPIVIDETSEPAALVPDRFRKMQWTRLPGGDVTPEVLARLLKLWSHRTGTLAHQTARAAESQPSRAPTNPAFLSGRRLAAILFTDVVGYSQRMQRDENGTLSLVKADFAVMRDHCTEHGGEVLNSMGDGLLLCFPSAVQAVTCALQIQSEFGQRRATLPPERALEHRMGIHIGDVIQQDDGGVAGDGVNIAARLEGKAPVGGVCVSQMVYDTVNGKVPMQAVFGGPEMFKNITNPIPIWHLAPVGGATPSRPPMPVAQRVRRSLTLPVAAAAVVLAAGGYFLLKRPAEPAPVPASTASTAEKKPPSAPAVPAASEKSLVVLPLDNLSPDPEVVYFADGMHTEIISTLQGLPGLKVISRMSALTFKGSKAPLAKIAQELGVANVIVGTVRREKDTVRIQLELRRASDEALLWSLPKRDRTMTEVLALQSEIADEVARLLQARDARGMLATARFMTKSPQAYDLYLKMQNVFWAGIRQAGPAQTTALLESARFGQAALELDSTFVSAAQQLGHNNVMLYDQAGDPAQRATYKTEARRWAETTSRLAPGGAGDSALLHYHVKIERDFPRAVALGENGVRVQPNDSAMWNFYGIALRRIGRLSEAVVAGRQAIAVDPRLPPQVANLFIYLSFLRRGEEAVAAIARFDSLVPVIPNIGVRNFAVRSRFQLFGTMPPDLTYMTAPDQADWLWRMRKTEALLALVEKELAGSGQSPVARFTLQLRRSDALRQKGDTGGATEAAQAALAVAEELKRDAATKETEIEMMLAEDLFLRGQVDEVVANDAEIGMMLAEALVRLGRADEAVTAARRAVESIPEATELAGRMRLEGQLAGVCAQAGRAKECLELLARVLRFPSGLTVPMLRVEPRWDRVREEAGFKALLADPKNSAPL